LKSGAPAAHHDDFKSASPSSSRPERRALAVLAASSRRCNDRVQRNEAAETSSHTTAAERSPDAAESKRRRPADDRATPLAEAGTEAVLALQRSAGNVAVARALAARKGAPLTQRLVQRYEAGEHAQFGGAWEFTFKPKGKVAKLTEGDVIALGDFYESPQEMLAADADEINKLVALIHRDRDFYEKGIGKPVGNDEWQDATMGRPAGKRFLDLAAKNAPHFGAPAGTTSFHEGEDDNRSKWFKHFREACRLAQEKRMGAALATNAYAAHFLTDAFSAGHMINKAATMAKAKDSPAATKKQREKDPRISDEKTRRKFEERVAKGILDDPKGRALYAYEANPGAFSSWAPMNVSSLADVIDRIHYWKEAEFFSMFVRAVHDRLDVDIATVSGGIEVTNKAGDGPWRLSGDATLGKSKKTLDVARKAVDKAREAVQSVEGKKVVDYEALAQTVWDFVPVPTAAGQKQIDKAEKKLLDPKQVTASDAWVKVAIENFAALEKGLLDNGLIRKKPAPAPKKAPAPSTPLPVGPKY
jgi:hypothetical protein